MVVLVAGTKDLACAVVVAGYYIRACRPQCVCVRARAYCPCAALHVVYSLFIASLLPLLSPGCITDLPVALRDRDDLFGVALWPGPCLVPKYFAKSTL